MTDFVQFAIETSDATVFCLDTLQAGSDAGEFCAQRRSWLSDKLDRFSDRPIILFLHHPPMPLGLPMQDADRMRDGAVFLDLIEGCTNVKHLCIGHVHRPVTGTVRGIPFTTMRSVLYQAPAPRPAWDWESFRPAREAPNFGLVGVADGDVNIQFQQFCPFAYGVREEGPTDV